MKVKLGYFTKNVSRKKNLKKPPQLFDIMIDPEPILPPHCQQNVFIHIMHACIYAWITRGTTIS